MGIIIIIATRIGCRWLEAQGGTSKIIGGQIKKFGGWNVQIEGQRRFPRDHGGGGDVVSVVDDGGGRIAVAMTILREERRRAWVATRGRSGCSSRSSSRRRVGPTEGFNGRAQTAGSRSVRVINLKSRVEERIWSVEGMRVRVRVRIRRVIEKRDWISKREVGFSFRSTEGYSGVVVSTSGVLGGIEGS